MALFTSPSDDLPEVLAARAAVKAAQARAYAQPDDDSLWAVLEAAEEALGEVLKRVRPANPCNCESVHHYTVEDVPEHSEYPRDGHPFMAVPAGSRRAWGVGEVCDACADTHMAPYLIDPLAPVRCRRGSCTYLAIDQADLTDHLMLNHDHRS